MGRTCTVCFHPQRADIDLALLMHSAPYRTIAKRYRLTHVSLIRHQRDHLRHSLQLSKELTAMLAADNILENLAKWHERTERQYSKADNRGDYIGAAGVIRTAVGVINSFARQSVEADLDAKFDELVARRIPAVPSVPADDDKDGQP